MTAPESPALLGEANATLGGALDSFNSHRRACVLCRNMFDPLFGLRPVQLRGGGVPCVLGFRLRDLAQVEMYRTINTLYEAKYGVPLRHALAGEGAK